MLEASSSVLVVDDDAGVARSLRRLLLDTRPSVLANDAETAEALLADNSRRWCGFIFDLRLGGRSGLELLDHRANARFAPTLLITGYVDPAASNRAYARGASLISKPIGTGELEVFSRDVVAFDAGLTGQLRAATVALAMEHGLTFAETETLAQAVRHLSGAAIATRRGVTRNTYRSQVNAIREKLGVSSLKEACALVLEAAQRVD